MHEHTWLRELRASNETLWRTKIVALYEDSGGNLQRVATTLQVNRKTVSRWRREDDELRRQTPSRNGRPRSARTDLPPRELVRFAPFVVERNGQAARLSAVAHTGYADDAYAVRWDFRERHPPRLALADGTFTETIDPRWQHVDLVPPVVLAQLTDYLRAQGWTVVPPMLAAI